LKYYIIIFILSNVFEVRFQRTGTIYKLYPQTRPGQQAKRRQTELTQLGRLSPAAMAQSLPVQVSQATIIKAAFKTIQ